VTGLGASEARIGIELFGPFATRAAIACTGKPYDTAEVFAQGDGTLRTPAVRIRDAGFYTYRAHLAGTDLIAETTTECPVESETALARPLIITGRNDVTGVQRWSATDPLAPTRVRVANLGIDAPVSPAGIDVKAGVLDVPAAISRLGWWLDGRLPGDAAGAVLIAGHVDSATAGAGALFRLKDARSGDLIQVTTRNGRTFTYRVTSVKTMAKADLPTSIYSRSGKPRLVLVTCGGPFDASIRHYRDNVVVTAVPA
jgi:LPXTG-site transpeptidase (sortase) family protein